ATDDPVDPVVPTVDPGVRTPVWTEPVPVVVVFLTTPVFGYGFQSLLAVVPLQHSQPAPASARPSERLPSHFHPGSLPIALPSPFENKWPAPLPSPLGRALSRLPPAGA